MLERLKERNEIEVYSVFDDVFRVYGRVIEDLDTAEIVRVAAEIPMTDAGCVYHAAQPEFQNLAIANRIRRDCFAEMPCQIGMCYGHNHFLNSLEWHTCSEINIAATDVVVILGKRRDMDAHFQMSSTSCKAFFLPKGTAMEIYSDTLHFCPCEVEPTGYRMIVGLAEGTNTPLEQPTEDKKIRAKNKWAITHERNTVALKNGCFCGITGPNYEIKY